MKKTMSAILVSSILLSSSVFASTQSLSEIMSTYKDEVISLGSETAIQHSVKAIAESKISENEMREYLASELSPKDYRKVEESLNKGILLSDVPHLVMNTSNGANFIGFNCGAHKSAIMVMSGVIGLSTALIAGTFVYNSIQNRDSADEYNGLTHNVYNSAEKDAAILDQQAEITALINSGASPSSGYVAYHELQIAKLQQDITDGKAFVDWQNNYRVGIAAGYNHDADQDKKMATTLAIVSGVSLATLGSMALVCK